MTTRSDLLLAIRAFAGTRFEVLGELGADGRGDLLYLAREKGGAAAGDRLIGLRVESPERAVREGRTVALAMERGLDALVAGQPRCARCAAPLGGEEGAAPGETVCRSCAVTPLSGELVRERPTEPFEIGELLALYRLDGWVPEGGARLAPDGTPFHYVRDADATRVLLLFLRAERPQPGVVLHRPCLAPAFADHAPPGPLPGTPSPAALPPGVGPSAVPRTDPTGTAAGAVPSAPSASAGQPAGGTARTCPQCGARYADDTMFCPRDGTTLRVAHAASSLVGSVVADRYHVLDVLGEGGMGRVYLAEHVKIRRRCALKVMSERLSQDVDAVGRFVREAENAARVSHPNVAAVYDFGETPDGLAYMAMELVEGEPLSKLLRDGGALPLARAADMARQIALGLAAAHELGIVHRDLKPDNVMVSRGRDGRDQVKVVDFGIAKAEGGDGQQITRTGLVIGTPEYMSPEQLMGEPVDGRSDIYSLGCILYRMLTARAPFADAGGESVLARLTRQPEPPGAVRPGIPAALDEVTMLALAAQPSLRVESAEALAAMLEPFAVGLAGTSAATLTPAAAAVAMPAAGPVAAPATPTPTAATAGAAAAVSVGAGSAGSRGSGGRGWRVVAAAAVLALAGAGGWAVLGRGGDAVAGGEAGPPSGAAASAPDGGAPREVATADLPPDARTEPRNGGDEAGQAPVTPLRGPAVPAAGGSGASGGRAAARDGGAVPPVSPPRGAAGVPRIDDAPAREVAGAAGSSGSVAPGPAAVPATLPAPSNVLPAPAAPAAPTAGGTAEGPVVLTARDAVRESAAALVARYERAINARDLGELRALCELTGDQQKYWRDLISDTRSVKGLNARLRIVQITGDASPFTLEVAGAIDFRDLRNSAQSVPYRARFRASGDAAALTCGTVTEQFGR